MSSIRNANKIIGNILASVADNIIPYCENAPDFIGELILKTALPREVQETLRRTPVRKIPDAVERDLSKAIPGDNILIAKLQKHEGDSEGCSVVRKILSTGLVYSYFCDHDSVLTILIPHNNGESSIIIQNTDVKKEYGWTCRQD